MEHLVPEHKFLDFTEQMFYSEITSAETLRYAYYADPGLNLFSW